MVKKVHSPLFSYLLAWDLWLPSVEKVVSCVEIHIELQKERIFCSSVEGMEDHSL